VWIGIQLLVKQELSVFEIKLTIFVLKHVCNVILRVHVWAFSQRTWRHCTRDIKRLSRDYLFFYILEGTFVTDKMLFETLQVNYLSIFFIVSFKIILCKCISTYRACFLWRLKKLWRGHFMSWIYLLRVSSKVNKDVIDIKELLLIWCLALCQYLKRWTLA